MLPKNLVLGPTKKENKAVNQIKQLRNMSLNTHNFPCVNMDLVYKLS